MSQNIIYLGFKTELWHLCKSMLPSAKGLSIYFYVVSSPYARVMVIFTFPFYILSFGKHIVLERS